ncbi:hypothetical protein MTO96_003166 [Rhipicephalus appendiculatus]
MGAHGDSLLFQKREDALAIYTQRAFVFARENEETSKEKSQRQRAPLNHRDSGTGGESGKRCSGIPALIAASENESSFGSSGATERSRRRKRVLWALPLRFNSGNHAGMGVFGRAEAAGNCP